MSSIEDCFTKIGVDELTQKYILAKRSAFLKEGLDENAASHKAIDEFRNETIESLADVHNQIADFSGKEKPFVGKPKKTDVTSDIIQESSDNIQTVLDNVEDVKSPIYKEVLKSGDSKAVTEVLKEVSDQWHDEGTRSQTERDFGLPIVNAAKKLFPQETQKSLSTAQPKADVPKEMKGEDLLKGVDKKDENFDSIETAVKGKVFNKAKVSISDLISKDEDLQDYLNDSKEKKGRVVETPIIVGDISRGGTVQKGGVIDGFHRIAQALANGETEIDAYVEKTQPIEGKKPDVVEKSYDKNLITPIDNPENVSVNKLKKEAGVLFVTQEKKDAIQESVNKEGIKTPIIVNKDNGDIIDGSHRLAAAQEAGIKNIPVIYVKGLSRKDGTDANKDLVKDVSEKYSTPKPDVVVDKKVETEKSKPLDTVPSIENKNVSEDETFNLSAFSYEYEKKNKPPKKPSANEFSGKGGVYTGGGSEKSMRGVNTTYRNKLSDHNKKLTEAYINHVYSELKNGKTPSTNQIKSFASTLNEEGRNEEAIKLLKDFGFTQNENSKWIEPKAEEKSEPQKEVPAFHKKVDDVADSLIKEVKIDFAFAGGRMSGEIIEDKGDTLKIRGTDGYIYPIKKSDILKEGETIKEHYNPETKKTEFDEKVDKFATNLINKLTPKSTKGVKKAGLGIEEVIRLAAGIVKAAHHAKTNINAAIDQAVDFIKDNWNKAWGEFKEQDFRDIFSIHNEAAEKFKSLKPEDAIINLRKSNDLTQKALRAKKTSFFKKFYKGWVKHIEDISGNAKESLRNAGGEEAVMMKDISSKSGGKASLKIDENDKKIFKGLKEDEVQDLGNIIQAKRTIQLDEIYDKRGVERLKHKLGYTKEFYEKALEGMKAENPERFADLSKRADDYFAAQKELLDLKKENGLISDELYDYLLEQSMYSPRVFIQHLDDMATSFNGGKKISAGDNGIKALDEGSEGLMLEDPRLLLAMSTNKAFWLMGKNDAAKSLHKFAEDTPDNGVVKERPIVDETKDGKPIYGDVPNGMEVLHAMVNGDKKDMLVSKEFANDWISTDPAIAPGLGEAIQWVTMSAPLRYAATGINPLFALTNVPRDLAFIYFTTHGVFSKHLPVAFAQIHADMLKVLPDVWSRKGRYKEFVNEGGSIELLTHQGRFYTGGGINEGINKVSHVLGWVGETSELLTRIAMRERGITNRTEKFVKENNRQPNVRELKKIKTESTYDAINQLDFSQGGDWSKALNKFVPYTNAAVQGMRGFAREIRTNPKGFAYKAAQLMAVAGALVVYNMAQEGWDDVDEREKAKFYIIMLGGLYRTDEKGRKRYLYAKIPKSQETQFVSSIAESAVEFTATGKKPDKSIVHSLKNQSPPIPFVTHNPPIVDFFQAYEANYDSYFNERIWKGRDEVPEEEKVYPTTPEIYKKIGKAIDKSPAQVQRATNKIFPIDKNPFITIPGKGFYLAMEGMGVKEKDELNKSFVSHMKDVFGGVYKRYVGETFPTKEKNVGSTITIKHPTTFKTRGLTVEENKKYKAEINKNFPILLKKFTSNTNTIWVDVNDKIHLSKEGGNITNAEKAKWKPIKSNKLLPEQINDLEDKVKDKVSREAEKKIKY